MTEKVNSKLFDLEARTQIFAKGCREFVKKLPKAVGNYEDGKQLVRSSGSTTATISKLMSHSVNETSVIESRFVEKRQKNLFFG